MLACRYKHSAQSVALYYLIVAILIKKIKNEHRPKSIIFIVFIVQKKSRVETAMCEVNL